jgi:hypothetical protein
VNILGLLKIMSVIRVKDGFGARQKLFIDSNPRLVIRRTETTIERPKITMSNLALLFDGNSITSYGYPALISPAIPATAIWRSLNKGYSGQQVSALNARAASEIDPLIVVGKNNILIILEITNSIQLGGTARSAANDLWVYCDARKAAGWKVVVCTAPPLVSTLVVNAGNLVVDANQLVRDEWTAHAQMMCRP